MDNYKIIFSIPCQNLESCYHIPSFPSFKLTHLCSEFHLDIFIYPEHDLDEYDN